MNGAQHYAEAERLLADALLPNGEDYEPEDECIVNIQAAQVHATLALTAATIDTANGETEATPWLEAIR